MTDGRLAPATRSIPGGRQDIRERSALVGLHVLRILLGWRGVTAVVPDSPEPFEIHVADQVLDDLGARLRADALAASSPPGRAGGFRR